MGEVIKVLGEVVIKENMLDCKTPTGFKVSRKNSFQSPKENSSEKKSRPGRSFRQSGASNNGIGGTLESVTFLGKLSQRAKDRKEKLGFLDFIGLKREAMAQNKNGKTLGEALEMNISVKTEILVRKCARRMKNIAKSKVIAKKLLLNDLSFLSKEGSQLSKAINVANAKDDDIDPRDKYLTLKKLKAIEPLAKQYGAKILKHMVPNTFKAERLDDFKMKLTARKKERLEQFREANKKLSNYARHMRVIEAREQLSNEIMEYVSKNFENPDTILTLIEKDCTSRDLTGLMKRHKGVLDSARDHIYSDKRFQIRVKTLPSTTMKPSVLPESPRTLQSLSTKKNLFQTQESLKRSESKKRALKPILSRTRQHSNKPLTSILLPFTNGLPLLQGSTQNRSSTRIKALLETVSFSSQVHSLPEAECQSQFETRLDRLYNQVCVVQSKLQALDDLGQQSAESRSIANYLIDKRRSTASAIVKANKVVLR